MAAGVPRHLRDRPAEPGPADPLRHPQRARRRRRGAHLRAVERHGGRDARGVRAAVQRRVDSSRGRVRRARVQPVRRAHVHERAQHAGPGWHRAAHDRARAGRHDRARGRALHLQPRAARDVPRRDRARRRRGGRGRAERRRTRVAGHTAGTPLAPRSARCARAHRGRLRPEPLHPPLRGRPAHRLRRRRRRALDGRQAHGRGPRRVALPARPARAPDRGRARPAERRGLSRLHAGMPVLPGGDDHAPGARAPERTGPRDGAQRHRAHRLRRGRAHVPVDG